MKDFLLVIAYLLIGFALGYWAASKDALSPWINLDGQGTGEAVGQQIVVPQEEPVKTKQTTPTPKQEEKPVQKKETAKKEASKSSQKAESSALKQVNSTPAVEKNEAPKTEQTQPVSKESTQEQPAVTKPENVQPVVTEKPEFDPNGLTVASFVQDWIDSYAYLSIKNNTDKTITNFKATVIYKSMNDDVLDYEEINQTVSIAPQMAKSVKIKGFGHDMSYAYYKSEIRASMPDRKFKIEFVLKSYK